MSSASPEHVGAGHGEAGLGMYPFPELRPAYERYWANVHRRLSWVPPRLTWHDDIHESWNSPDLVVGHTCGWPLVTRLADRVQVVGTFVFDIPEADGPTYHSVVVMPHGLAADIGADVAGGLQGFAAGRTAAVNGPDSLSGWVSLIAAVHGPGARWQGEVRWTGAHVESLRALARGDAEIASIDAVTWAHAQRFEPEVCGVLTVVGAGPQVPCLPVVAGMHVSAVQLDELRLAMAEAIGDTEAADLALVRTQRFVPMTLGDYLPLLALAPAG